MTPGMTHTVHVLYLLMSSLPIYFRVTSVTMYHNHVITQLLETKQEGWWLFDFLEVFISSVRWNFDDTCRTGILLLRNKANLRDLIAATGLVIVLKLDSNHRFFSPCDLEIWWMTPKKNPASLLSYFKLCVSFHTHWWIQTGVTVRKRPIWVKIDDFLAVWPSNMTDDLEKQ